MSQHDDAPLSQSERDAKIAQFEEFINNRLKVDLDKCLTERDKIYEELNAFMELKQTIQLVKEKKLSECNSLINLGSDFYVQAHVPDTSMVFVKIGLGFHAEMTHEEAFDFIEVMDKHLNSMADKITEKGQHIQSQIYRFQDILQQLLQLPTIDTMIDNPGLKRKF